MKVVKSIKNLFFFLVIFLLVFNMQVNASSEPTICTKSKEYLEWEKLSDLEKEKTLAPVMCDMSIIYEEPTSTPFIYTNVKASLPSKFDGRTTPYIREVRSQSSTGFCWAFATSTALEMYAKKYNDLDYTISPRHIEYTNSRVFLNNQINEYGVNREVNTGGNYFLSSSYLINNLGPIAEDEMPFSTSTSKINISSIQNKKILFDVNDISLNINSENGLKCTSAQIQNIKNLVYNYGSVATTTYMTESGLYFNSQKNAYYYNGILSANHGILIVGWDDTFETTNFTAYSRPSEKGAWIVQNSYGTDFGEDGYYYISYEDVHICDLYMAITETDPYLEDNAYVHDKLGYMSYSGYGSKQAIAMNVFTKTSGKEESLDEIAFGTIGTGTYKIYYKEGNAKNSTISSMTLIGSGTINHSGYVTHKLTNPIILENNLTEFSIAVYFDMDNTNYPIALSSQDSDYYKYVSIDENKSFMSSDGTSWYDLSTKNYIASIKAFSNDTDYFLELKNIEVNNIGNKYNINVELEYENINFDKVGIILKDKEDNVVDINPTIDENGIISFEVLKNTMTKYFIELYYNGKYLTEKEFKIEYNILTSDEYVIDQDNLIIYAEPNTKVVDIVEDITGLSTNINTDGIAYTGMYIENYAVVVLGDVTRDGLVKMNDVMKIATYVNKEISLNTYELYASDITKDGYTKMNDVMMIASQKLGGN